MSVFICKQRMKYTRMPFAKKYKKGTAMKEAIPIITSYVFLSMLYEQKVSRNSFSGHGLP